MGKCIEFPKLTESGGDDSPLISEGKYELTYLYHTTWLFMGRQPKVVVYFAIMEPGEYFQVVLPAYYNAIKHIGRRCKYGNFKAAKKSNLVRDFCRIFPTQPLPRLDRIPMRKLESIVVLGTVVNVKKDFEQREIPKMAQYSRVAMIDKW
jgi:hypothetical protein